MEEPQNYIEQSFKGGSSAGQVRVALLGSGWPTPIVDAAIEEHLSRNRFQKTYTGVERLSCVAAFVVSCLLAIATHYHFFK